MKSHCNRQERVSVYVRLFLLLLFAASAMGGGKNVSAQEETYDGLDVVFLVDQSGSMARLRGGGVPNDPLGYRFYSIWYSMYWLGEDHLSLHGNASYRMAVINFGDRAEAWEFNDDPRNPYWKDVSPTSRDEWEPLRKELTEAIQTDMQGEFSKRDLGNTDFLRAFQAARDLFRKLPSASGNHLRVIITLTDGQPNASGVRPIEHLQDVLEYSQNNFPAPDYRVYVVGMLDVEEAYWDDVRYYWETITADPCTPEACPDADKDRAGLVKNNDEAVGRRFQTIFRDLTKNFPRPTEVRYADEEVIPGPVVLPPYLKSVMFTYFKATPSEHLVLTEPAGVVIGSGSPGVEVEGMDGPIEAVRVMNPSPGKWLVTTEPTAIDVVITMRQIFAQSRLESPSASQVQYIPITIRYTLLDDLGQPLPTYTDPRYRLIVQATVEAEGQSWPLTLNSTPDNAYEATFVPEVVGSHSISVSAVSQDLNGNRIVVFDGEIGAFEVTPAVLRPVNLPVTWLQHEEKELTFELQSQDGFAVTASGPLEIIVTIDGEEGEPVKLIPLPDGTYQGKYTPHQSGTHNIHVTATLRDTAGKLKVITDEDVGSFEVVPTMLVDLKVLTPKESPFEQENTGLWPFERNPFVLEIQLSDENGNPLPPEQIFVAPGNALSVVVKQDGKPIPGALTLQSTSDVGRYRAETTGLGLGEYDIEISGGALHSGYMYFDPASPQKTIHVKRILHPLHLPILIGALLLLAVVATSATAAIVGKSRSKQHPCRGLLYVVDSYGAPKFQARLDSFGKNRIVFTSRNINPLTHIRRLDVICRNAQESQNGEVHVTLWLDKDRNPALYQHSMRRGSEIRVGKYSFWLLKDPDEDQLSRDRLEDGERL